MDLAEGEEAVPVAAVVDERRLQRRLYPGDLGEIDVAFELALIRALEVELLEPLAIHHDDPGLFRVGGVDQHASCHYLKSPIRVRRTRAVCAGGGAKRL